MKIRQNKKIAGRLLMASGVMFFIAAAMLHQLPFIGVGVGLFTIGFVLLVKRDETD